MSVSAAKVDAARKNGKLGGRPKGAVSKISRAAADRLLDAGRTPLNTMLRNMWFWDDQAERFGKQLESLILDEGDEDQRAEALATLRKFLAAREQSQRCAVDAAPYCHAKIHSIAVKADTAEAESVEITMTLAAPRSDTEERAYRGNVTELRPRQETD